ncbi:hypothetical protein VAPA_2c05100 [Variovorax paradoxus B4]|uniref:Uncharacterized protein n=1 Tax=Variovorax paradoxus B4 TaxID=1246301 RepID=T1XLT2_VARPD|nr:hypothetical protein VAPA_2c05100 [Variovorax paradoxus B4]
MAAGVRSSNLPFPPDGSSHRLLSAGRSHPQQLAPRRLASQMVHRLPATPLLPGLGHPCAQQRHRPTPVDAPIRCKSIRRASIRCHPIWGAPIRCDNAIKQLI